MSSWRISSMGNKPDRRLVFAVLCLLAVFSAAASLCFGAAPLGPGAVVQALLEGDAGTVEGRIVLLVRLPRTCGSLLAGAALAVSGAVIQGVLNNPLAAPNIIGVNSGAGLTVALCCAVSPTFMAAIPVAAFCGALAGVLLVLALAERTGASRITVVLAGVAISAMFSAGIDAVVTFAPEALNGYSDFRIGGFSNLSMARVAPAAGMIALALAAVFSLSHELDILMLGTETAQSLGLPAKRLRLILLALAAALAGAAVSFAGLLGFVGLIVPHVMRRLIGEDSLPLLAASALGGGVLVTVCDLLSRTLFAPYELPVGILLALAGGPFFIWLLLRQRGGRTHD